MRYPKILLPFLPAAVVCLILSGCKTEKEATTQQSFRDTTVNVYGPYTAVKLPIKTGVKMGNPIQLALSPNGFLFASNQTGEVYTLQDSDGDNLEDHAALFCNVKDDGLRSPVGLAFRGDTVFVGTAQQVRAYLDIDNDNKADTSWTFLIKFLPVHTLMNGLVEYNLVRMVGFMPR